jgi:hypothetical protein
MVAAKTALALGSRNRLTTIPASRFPYSKFVSARCNTT